MYPNNPNDHVNIKMWKVFIHHFVFRIWQRGTFKSVKYELTHSEARNINCNQCKYVRVAVLWQPPFLADCDLWMTICRQMGRSVNDMQEKISCAPHISAIYKHCTAYKCLTGWISRGNLTARWLFSWQSAARPDILPTYHKILIICPGSNFSSCIPVLKVWDIIYRIYGHSFTDHLLYKRIENYFGFDLRVRRIIAGILKNLSHLDMRGMLLCFSMLERILVMYLKMYLWYSLKMYLSCIQQCICYLSFDLSLSNSTSAIASLNWRDFAPGRNCAL